MGKRDSKARKILEAAKKRIKDPEHWGKGRYACNAFGQDVNPQSSKAVKFCALGSMQAEYEDISTPVYYLASDTLHAALPAGYNSVINFNDTASHNEVMQLFDRAIASLS